MIEKRHAEKANRVLVSVIIPAYNAESRIKRCILSAAQQAFDGKEIIVVDDGSQDDTARRAEELAAICNAVTVIRASHHCQGAARNIGIRKSSGQYLVFLDADDQLKEGALNSLYNSAIELDADLLTFDCDRVPDSYGTPFAERAELVPGNRVYTGKDFWNKYHDLGGVYYSAPLHFVNKAFLIQNDLFFEEDLYYEDNDWIVRAYNSAGRVVYLPEKLYVAENRVDSTTNKMPSTRTIISVFKIQEILRGMLVSGKYSKNMMYNVAEQNLARLEKMRSVLFSDEVKKSFSEMISLYKGSVSDVLDEDLFDMDYLFWKAVGTAASAQEMTDSMDAAIETVRNLITAFYGMSGDSSTAIWGTGDISRRFIRWCGDRGIDLPKDTVFIETTPGSVEFMKHRVIAAGDVDWNMIETIVLAASAENRSRIIKSIPDEQRHKIRQVHPLLLEGRLSYDRKEI